MWSFRKKEKKEYHFVEYVVSSKVYTFVDTTTLKKYFISTKDSDGVIQRYMYADEVDTLELAKQQILMLNKALKYVSKRFTIKIINDINGLQYSFHDCYGEDLEEHKTFFSIVGIVNYLNSIELKDTYYKWEEK